MGVLKNLSKNDSKTVDYFIDAKVDDLIERAEVEGQKRRQLETKVVEQVADPNSEVSLEYFNSIADFSNFPKYTGRGVQSNAPEITSESLTMRFDDVVKEEVEEFIALIVNDGFVKDGSDYVKSVDGKKYSIAIENADSKLRIFYHIG